MPRENNGCFPKGHIPWNKGRKGYPSLSPQTTFKKGHLPQTTRPIGSEWIDGDGFVRIKVCNDKNKAKSWKLKHHVIYEKYHPDVKINSRTHRIVFLDGDKRNFDINNLELITIREQMMLARMGWPPHSQEDGRAVVNMARLFLLMRDKGYNPRPEYEKKYRETHKEHIREWFRNYKMIHPEKVKEWYQNSMSKKRLK